MRILNLEPVGYDPQAAAFLGKLGEVTEGPLSREALLRSVEEFDVLVVRLAHQIDRDVLRPARRLHVIVSATTGLDHIDLDAARERGIAVLSLQGELDFLATVPATAEHTWALLLALARRVPAAHASVVGGGWDRDRFRGHDLAGKRLGILGLGRIGRRIARYGLAFDMRTAAYDPAARDWPDGVERLPTLQSLLRSTDVLTIHVPLNDATRGMLGARELTMLPRGACLVNTSRGEVLDESALAAALASGHLGGAALDVLRDERDPALRGRSPLLAYARTHDNLLLTPHLGGATVESMARTERFMAEKLARHLEENPL